jgi:hypothetical protein
MSDDDDDNNNDDDDDDDDKFLNSAFHKCPKVLYNNHWRTFSGCLYTMAAAYYHER